MQKRNVLFLPFDAVVLLSAFAILIASASPPANAKDKAPNIQWHEWNDALFRRAKAQNRFIVLDLSARWCHWCHFMEKRTYAHPDVRQLVHENYLAVKVDQDANPDLASRYGDWGWPATIIFDPSGNEVAKLQGFQRPSLMTHILNTIVAEPENVPKLLKAVDVTPSSTPFLDNQQRKKLLKLLDETYDREHAGWGRRLKFLQPEVIEYALERARLGDKKITRRLRGTLDAALVLLDPVWGGTYQYSHKRDWSAPHYEKIMAFQANGITLYSKAYLQFKDPKYLKAAENISSYLLTKLKSPEGAFYTSQDADVDHDILGKDFYALDAEGREKLVKAPSIDTNIYARENGWAARALVDLYKATGKTRYLKAAKKSLEWIVANRSLPGNGFSHGDADRGGPFLSDSLAMAHAMLAFYMASGETLWLERAADTADFIVKNFKADGAGFATTNKPPAQAAAFDKPFVNIEENIHLARFANMLHRTHGSERFRDMAVRAMQYLTSDAITSKRRFMLGIVLADNELAIEPAHITIIGPAKHEKVRKLHQAALSLPVSYKRVDLWDPATGPMFNPDVEYPELPHPAAFACANQICSLPISEPMDLAQKVQKMMNRRTKQR